MLGMIERDRRDHAGQRAIDHVGGIEPAAQADLEQQHIGGMAREQDEPGGGRDLEQGDGGAGIGALAFVERGGAQVRASVPRALAPIRKRSLKRTRWARCRRARSDPRSSIARMKAMVEPLPLVPATWIAGGSRRSDDRAQPDAPHPVERKIDPLGMQRSEPRHDGLDRDHWPRSSDRPRRDHAIEHIGSPAAADVPTARLAFGAGGGRQLGRADRRAVLVNSRHRLARVGRNWRRSTTMSTMPCCLRYSGALETFRQLLADGLLDDARPGEADERPGSAMCTSPSMA